MTEVIGLGCPEGRLCGELAGAIARSLTTGAETGCEGATFYHESDPVFEEATALLRDLALAAPLPREDAPDEHWYCLHALTMDAARMPGALRAGRRVGIERVLVVFLRLAERDGLPMAASTFTPLPPYAAAMRALVRAGYAQDAAGGLRWQSRIAPAMRAAGIWEADFLPRGAREDDDRRRQAALAWKAMPETVRRAHFGARATRLVPFVDLLSRSWRDGRWQDLVPGEVEPPPGHVALARSIIALAGQRA